MAEQQGAANSADRELRSSRLFDAPRDRVFEMWTDERHLARWWGPRGFTTTTHDMDFRTGGQWRFTMHGPDGRDYRNRIIYVEVVRPERIAYKHAPEKGTEPVAFEVTVLFTDEGGKTRLDMRMLFPSTQAREHVIKTYGADKGLEQTLDRLVEEVAKG